MKTTFNRVGVRSFVVTLAIEIGWTAAEAVGLRVDRTGDPVREASPEAVTCAERAAIEAINVAIGVAVSHFGRPKSQFWKSLRSAESRETFRTQIRRHFASLA